MYGIPYNPVPKFFPQFAKLPLYDNVVLQYCVLFIVNIVWHISCNARGVDCREKEEREEEEEKEEEEEERYSVEEEEEEEEEDEEEEEEGK